MAAAVTIHRLTWNPDRYQGLSWDVSEEAFHMGLTYFDAKPRADGWDVPPIVIRSRRLRRPDIWRFGAAAVLAFDNPTVERLEPFFSAAGELLPLSGPDN